ncbi:MAG: hypothetical protein SO160_02275 [Lachnospiraceae bacterium]|nr:hypothetical protein [Lachnospiraceae bacterium]
MIDLRDTTQVTKLPIEMLEAGKAINKAIINALKVRIRVHNNDGFYVDMDTVITCCLLNESKQTITINGSGLDLEFSYKKFELNNMSSDTHTKFYFRQKESVLGITVTYPA